MNPDPASPPLPPWSRWVLPTLLGFLTAAVVLAAGFSGCKGAASRSPTAASTPETRGREVYIREGCMHCHSQYVRPESPDEEFWGPYRAPSPEEHPPLIGNRRQGPDLLNVGNRRNTEWLRQHLIDPPEFTPGSRMPSYAKLFEGGSGDGEDLVAFLTTLGKNTLYERDVFIEKWVLPRPERQPDVEQGKQLFLEHCSQCHGESGNGHGELNSRLSLPPSDLTRPGWTFLPSNLEPEQQKMRLARLIKFGIRGLPMPGHETLETDEIHHLIAWLEKIKTTGDPTP